MEQVILGKVLVSGSATGSLLASRSPLSFWGGYSQFTGEVIDRRHSLSGKIAKNRILAIPASRGSSTTTSVFLEAVRRGTAPKAIILAQTDSFLVLASVVAEELYHQSVPMIALEPNTFQILKSGQQVTVNPDGKIIVRDP